MSALQIIVLQDGLTPFFVVVEPDTGAQSPHPIMHLRAWRRTLSDAEGYIEASELHDEQQARQRARARA